MRRLILVLSLLSLVLVGAEKTPRRAVLSEETDRIEDFEIVSQNNTPLMKWTAEMLQRSLEAATGRKAEILNAPSGQRLSIIIGDCDLAKAAGIDVSALPEEGYYILRKGDRLFLAGRDDPKVNPTVYTWMQRFPRSSLSACYDFLERFADARFAFPGEFGTVIPNRKALFLPKEIDIMERPDHPVRMLHIGRAKGTSLGAFDKLDGIAYINLVAQSQRWGEFGVPFIHGLAHINLVERFKDTRPEYFALLPDGRRHITPDIRFTGHLCFSNKEVREVIYQDVKAFLTGVPAEKRGISYWPSGSFCGKYASVMPHDAFYWCNCEECAKIAKGGNFCNKGYPLEERKKAADAINDVIWTFTKEIAERLTREGVEGSVTQMAYHPSTEPPDFKLPDNIEIQVAVDGLGNKSQWKENRELLQRWKEKTGKSLSVWTYPGKHMGKAEMRGIPAMMHHQMGEYFQYLGDYCSGAFIEEETDFVIFNFLNDYVCSHVLWDTSTNVEELLDDLYRSMFGAGAPQMKRYFDTLEHLWCDRILGNVIASNLGPVQTLPTIYEVWRSIYSPAQMEEFETLFNDAEAAATAANEKDAVGRIQYIRKAFHGLIVKACENQKNSEKDYRDWTVSPGETVSLHGRFWGKVDVHTTVTVADEASDFVFTFNCEEPMMDAMVANVKGDVLDGPCHEDSDVELFLNPSGDRKSFIQIVANSNGALFDEQAVLTKRKTSWNSGTKVVVERGDDFWKAVIRVPKAALGEITKDGMPVNFARHRVIKGKSGNIVEDYQWTLSTNNGFGDISAWGRLVDKPRVNILRNADFTEADNAGNPLNWHIWREKPDDPQFKVTLDTQVFVTGGQSLRIDKPQNGRIAANQRFKGKPNTKYSLSFYVKTENLVPFEKGVGAGAWIQAGKKAIPFPESRVYGTTPWLRYKTEFETTEDGFYSIGLWNWFSSGTAWFDHVILEENAK